MNKALLVCVCTKERKKEMRVIKRERSRFRKSKDGHRVSGESLPKRRTTTTAAGGFECLRRKSKSGSRFP